MPSRNRGKPKPKLRDLSRIPPTYEERAELRNAVLYDESSTTTAILGTSMVEHELETELRDCFRRSDDVTWKSLTSDIGPIGTFNQKIIAAYGLGIIDETLKGALDTIRQIRNAFAHSKRIISFKNDLVVHELKNIQMPKAKKSNLYRELDYVRTIEGGPRYAFVSLCMIVTLKLLDRRLKRSNAKLARIKTRDRRQKLSKAYRQRHASPQNRLLTLLGGYRTVDPRRTILGEASLEESDPETNEPDNKDK